MIPPGLGRTQKIGVRNAAAPEVAVIAPDTGTSAALLRVYSDYILYVRSAGLFATSVNVPRELGNGWGITEEGRAVTANYTRPGPATRGQALANSASHEGTNSHRGKKTRKKKRKYIRK